GAGADPGKRREARRPRSLARPVRVPLPRVRRITVPLARVRRITVPPARVPRERTLRVRTAAPRGTALPGSPPRISPRDSRPPPAAGDGSWGARTRRRSPPARRRLRSGPRSLAQWLGYHRPSVSDALSRSLTRARPGHAAGPHLARSSPQQSFMGEELQPWLSRSSSSAWARSVRRFTGS